MKDFRVNDSHYCTNDEIYQQELKESLQVNGSQYIKQQGEEEVRCRICYDDTECEENPLILPCKCKGSCGLIHFNCLK